MKTKNLWEQLDAAARPVVKKKLAELGWELTASGKNQWTALRTETDFEIQKMNPNSLLEAVEKHERKLEEQRERRYRFKSEHFT